MVLRDSYQMYGDLRPGAAGRRKLRAGSPDRNRIAPKTSIEKALAVLSAFNGPQANELILIALRDPDAGVQAAALRQLRPRRIPDALQILVSRLESPFGEVRDAAKGDDVARIKSAIGELEAASHAMSEALYKSAAGATAGAGAASPGATDGAGTHTADDDAIDAEFEVKS